MTYRVEILRSAAKELQSIHSDDRVRIIAALQNLANDPRPPGLAYTHWSVPCHL
jgi:mRNA-degrading endonuclease RelE of RelBE toxin-antitoxin system